MKTFTIRAAFVIAILSFGFSTGSKACYANFTHTNACVGDTVWFYALDFNAAQAWDFGDSTASNPNWSFSATAFHVYTAPGTYYVSHFVNIGAEYAFETQVITIGTDCFSAGFDASCGGSLYEIFENQSVGNSLSYLWDFGDPLSGGNNTSISQNPGGHMYSLPGTYTVTLIINDGIQSDTSIQVIAVDSICMSVSVSYWENPCAGDSTYFNIYTNGVTSLNWDFGDPASGASNYSTSVSPAHLFTTPGLYFGTVIYSNGITTDTFPIITNVVDCNVWPGDVNRDGKVTADDILAICLYNGDAGVPRPGASLNFTPQPSPDWSSGPDMPFMYLQDFINKKYADCNGDGIITVADVQAVTQNFGMVHLPHNTIASMQLVPPTAPHLSVTLPANVMSSDLISAELSLGDINHQLNGIYGYSIIIEYDPAVVNGSTISVDFSNAWLDASSQTNLFNWYHNDAANGKLYIVSARTDKNSVTGFGHLAYINFHTVPAFSGNLDLTINPDARVMMNNYFPTSGYGNIETFTQVNLDDATSTVALGIAENTLPENIHIYPSPANDFIRVDLPSQKENCSLVLYDALGKEVNVMFATHAVIPVQNLAAGIYLLKLVTGEKIYSLKIPVVH
jgi:PKD repeat protein